MERLKMHSLVGANNALGVKNHQNLPGFMHRRIGPPMEI